MSPLDFVNLCLFLPSMFDITYGILFSINKNECLRRCHSPYVLSLPCQCDRRCLEYGDCCWDYMQACRGSCSGRCNVKYSASLPCQCNSRCAEFGNCCADYASACGSASCAGRCNAANDATKSCQCNSACTRFGDCCSDYSAICTASSGSCSSLASVAQAMWDKDVNHFTASEMHLNLQSQIADGGSDASNGPLMTSVDTTKLRTSPTFAAFLKLRDNYNPVKGTAEHVTSTESAEETAFLSAILATDVMKTLQAYLVCRGKVADAASFRASLRSLWFGLYPRSGASTIKDTSAFEHVFVGEYQSSSKVNGFHNWVSFYEEEQAGSLNYYGYVTLVPLDANRKMVGAAFKWDNRTKALGSFLTGVSPEFDLGLFSLCFLDMPGKVCKFSLNGHPLEIQTYVSGGHMATGYIRPG